MRSSLISVAVLLLALGSVEILHRNGVPAVVSAGATDGELHGTRDPDADNPGEAHRWRMLRWRDEHGKIPADGLRNALADRQANLDAAARMPGPMSAGIGPLGWISRGPGNVAGRTRSLLVDPANANRLLAGAVGGGIWTSTDGGSAWSPVNDRFPSLAVCSLARDRNSPSTLYAGTGEGFFNGDALGGAGIYKSTDGGQQWTQLPATATWDNVCRIAVHPTNGNVLLAAKRYDGIMRSNDGGASWTSRYWTQGSYCVAFDPSNGQNAVAHVIDYDFGNRVWFHRAMYSTDAGVSWTPAVTGLTRVDGFDPRIELCYAPSSPNIVYASCALGGVIWRSTDGGKNYSQRTTSGSSGASWYANPLWVDPTNPNFLLTGGYHVYKSTDGGTNLTQISNGYILTAQAHPDVHTFVQDPGFNGTTNRRVYVCTDGGISRTDDIYSASTTSGWIDRGSGYRVTQFYGAAGDAASGRIVGGTQDNGTLRINAGTDQAVLMFGGDGGFCAIDWTNPLWCYGEYVTLQIHRSNDGGSSAGYIYSGIADAGTNANFIAPFVLDPNNPVIMLAGGASLWRTNNVRANTVTWSAIRPRGTDLVSAIAIAPGNSNVAWVGQNNGEVHKTLNATAASPTWAVVDNNGSANPLPDRYVERILIDQDDNNVAYVALGGFDPKNLWKTTNGGSTWTAITGSAPLALPAAPVHGIARHPTRSGWLYAGTEVGVFATENGGSSWSATNDGPVNTSVDELVFTHGSTTLLAATHGRGLWTAMVQAPGYTVFGQGCAGSAGTPTLAPDPSMLPRIGAPYRILLGNLRPGTVALVFLGDSRTSWNGVPLPLGLAGVGMPGCTLYCNGVVISSLSTGAGSGSFSFTVPPDPLLVGAAFYNQAFVLDQGANVAGIVASNAGAGTVGN